MRDMGNSSKEFKKQRDEFQKQRDAMTAAVQNSWNFPYPAAAAELVAEAVAKAHSTDGKKSGVARKTNSLTTPHNDEALELVRKARKLNPKHSSTRHIGKDMAEKFGGSGKTWERFITDAEDNGLVPKQIKTRTVRVRSF